MLCREELEAGVGEGECRANPLSQPSCFREIRMPNSNKVFWESPFFFHFPIPESVILNRCHCFTVAKSCPAPQDPNKCSTSGFPVLYYLPDFVQTHVHWISDGIHPSHPLSPPSPPALTVCLSIRVFPNQSALSNQCHKVNLIKNFGNSGVFYKKTRFLIDWFILSSHYTLNLASTKIGLVSPKTSAGPRESWADATFEQKAKHRIYRKNSNIWNY